MSIPHRPQWLMIFPGYERYQLKILYLLNTQETKDLHFVPSPRYFKYSVSISLQIFLFVQPLIVVASTNTAICYLKYASDGVKIRVKCLLQIRMKIHDCFSFFLTFKASIQFLLRVFSKTTKKKIRTFLQMQDGLACTSEKISTGLTENTVQLGKYFC